MLAAAIIAAALNVRGAAAADASAWDEDSRSGMRLVAGDRGRPAPNGAARAGIELKIAPGWKTYWRYPGDSGVPPRFDFSSSSNVENIAVLWPAPHRFRDESGQSIGYKDRVIFPLHIVAKDKSRPVTLRLNVDYAVCDKLCIPAQGKAELELPASSPANEPAIAAAEAQVPVRQGLGDGIDFAIRSVRRDTSGDRPRVLVDVMAPEHFAVDLFAEGPTPQWALPLPTPTSGAPAGVRRFAFDLDGLPPGAKADGATLTLTAVAGGSAIEVNARLD
jgi:DsbC/DsbD-like thiol-disulfide interchange protein